MYIRKPLQVRKFFSNEKGQVAIFVALVFQVLFVFFAMVINVGLVVHHKINLQNSADLAAYYGAAKQAEMLNAIAHVNYQIKQSYKLMTFRYRQIGTAGDVNRHPFDVGSQSLRPSANFDVDSTMTPTFCSSYPPFNIVTPTTTYCKELNGYNITLPSRPSLSSSLFFVNFTGPIIAASQNLISQALNDCKRVSALNWLQLARFITAYKMDIANRKKMIYLLANNLSKSPTDFTDLDGESVLEGVKKTFKKNLTSANETSLRQLLQSSSTPAAPGSPAGGAATSFSFFNSLGDDHCGISGGEFEPPKWLTEVNIFPLYSYIDNDCGGGEPNINMQPKWMNITGAASLPKYQNLIGTDLINLLKNYIDEPDGNVPAQRLYKSSVGFEKNPWCMAYVGAKVKSQPSIPFSPAGSVTLEAKAYAKPFGGRIGPWYGETWSQGQPNSDSVKKLDPLLPPRVFPGVMYNNPNDPTLVPNHARYVGDEVGISSAMTMGQMGKAIHTRGQINIAWWNHILDPNEDLGAKGTNGDMLAWDSTGNVAPTFRDTEIAALAPDQFDMTYYSIDPDFYRNYMQKIINGKLGPTIPFNVRGDLGMRINSPEKRLREFTIKEQVATAADDIKKIFDVKTKLLYFVLEPYQLLTSWEGKNPEDYSLDPTRFGKCAFPVKPEEPYTKATTGNCMAGGRTGYSVKLVSEDFLKSEMEIGGLGKNGRISNPPP